MQVEQCDAVGADSEKQRMPEIDLTGISDQDVPARRKNGEDRRQVKMRRIYGLPVKAGMRRRLTKKMRAIMRPGMATNSFRMIL